MKLQTKLVAVKRISSDLSRASFSAKEIEEAAHLILEVRGVINPIILRRTGLESFEVINGHFEYHAAVRAREISLVEGEMIQAIILEPENEAALLEQVNLLRKTSNRELELGTIEKLEPKSADLEDSQFEELRNHTKNLERSIAEIDNKIQNSGLEEELIKKLVKEVIKEVRPLISPSNSGKKKIDELKQNPLNLNSISQIELTTVPGIGKITSSRIVDRRNTKGNFSSVKELSEIDGITEKTINKYQWHECFYVSH